MSEHQDFPKYIEPHPSHIHRKPATEDGAPAHVSVPTFPHFHVARDGIVTVLVHDLEEELVAMSAAIHHEDEEA